jgi:uncharacterized protein YerC
MVNVNKKYLEENLKREIWDEFLKEIGKIKSQEELNNWIKKLFTESEKAILEKRLAIKYLFQQGRVVGLFLIDYK